jgi:hypothetical protein
VVWQVQINLTPECGRPRPQQRTVGEALPVFRRRLGRQRCCARGRAHSAVSLILILKKPAKADEDEDEEEEKSDAEFSDTLWQRKDAARENPAIALFAVGLHPMVRSRRMSQCLSSVKNQQRNKRKN